MTTVLLAAAAIAYLAAGAATVGAAIRLGADDLSNNDTLASLAALAWPFTLMMLVLGLICACLLALADRIGGKSPR